MSPPSKTFSFDSFFLFYYLHYLLRLAAVFRAFCKAGLATARLSKHRVAALAHNDCLRVGINSLHLVAAFALHVPEKRVGTLHQAATLVLLFLSLGRRVREIGVLEDHCYFWGEAFWGEKKKKEDREREELHYVVSPFVFPILKLLIKLYYPKNMLLLQASLHSSFCMGRLGSGRLKLRRPDSTFPPRPCFPPRPPRPPPSVFFTLAC